MYLEDSGHSIHTSHLVMNAEFLSRHIIAALFEVDADWIVRAANPKASTLLRRPDTNLVGRVLWDVFPGLRGTSAEAELRSAAQGSIERRFEFFSPSLYNWFEIWAVAREPGELYVFFRDITDRARAMQSDAVRESLRKILMAAPVAITITRGAEHRFELLNTAARAMVDGRNLEGLTFRNALPDLDPSLFELIDRVFQTGEPITMNDLEVTYDRTGDGQLYTGTFDITYQPMRGTDGSVEGIIQTAVETTHFAAARRQAELGERTSSMADAASPGVQ